MLMCEKDGEELLGRRFKRSEKAVSRAVCLLALTLISLAAPIYLPCQDISRRANRLQTITPKV